MTEQTAEQRLAEANDILIGAVENGPWVLITDPALRELVGGYVAETCHTVAAAAGLDEAMERAHDAMPLRLATAGRLVTPDARERLARHLYTTALGENLRRSGEEEWDTGQANPEGVQASYQRADQILAVITGQAAVVPDPTPTL